MKPHEQRVVDEKVELETKLDKLNEFRKMDVFKSLDVKQRILLDAQSGIMQQYVDILDERISAFVV